MRSLNARLLVAATFILAAFLGLTGLTLDQAFRQSAQAAVRDRLQAQVYMLLSAASFSRPEKRMMPSTLPDPRLSTPGSGLYAQLLRQDNTVVWRSASMLGLTLPLAEVDAVGRTLFHSATASDGTPLFELVYKVKWEGEGKPRFYTVQVAESTEGFDEQVQSFRRSLWSWLAAAAIVLLAVQAWIVRWGLSPLRLAAEEVREVETGRKSEVGGDYPLELTGLITNLNALIRHSKAHLERYRRALGDLAHSFKTPLAVLRGATESGGVEDLRATVREQVERLDRAVDYQLQRAAASGRSALARPVALEPLIRKIVQSLQKVYADKHLQFITSIAARTEFYGDEGDLMEIVGNLADNACKWARSKVAITVSLSGTLEATRPGLTIAVDDDGPGIPPEQWRQIFERGYRADTSVEGHGIGLAVVRDLVEHAYGGGLTVAASKLGGASVRAFIKF